MAHFTHDGRRLARETVRKKRQKIKDDIDFRGAKAGALPPRVRGAVVDNRLPGEKGGISVKTTSHFGPGGESAPNRAIGPAIEKVVAKKSLEKSLSNKGKDIEETLSDKGKDIPKEGGGSNKAALASTGLKLAGMESDSAGGGAIEGGLQAAAMTGNPYIIGGAAILGALQGSAKRKAHNKAMDAKAELGAAQAHSTGAAQSQAAMGQMSRAFSQYFS